MRKADITASLTCCLVSVTLAQDRFTGIIDGAAESTVTSGGFIVNQKRAAIQAEITRRPPSLAELGIKVPQGSKLRAEQTARQIAQYHPVWRVYDFSVAICPSTRRPWLIAPAGGLQRVGAASSRG